jgi:glutamate 5-kinase
MTSRRQKHARDCDVHRLNIGKEVVVVKVGSAVLADPDGRLDESMMRRLARLISAWRKRGRPVVLVSSGAIAAGRGVLGWSQAPHTLPEKQALAATGQSRLMHAYTRAFKRYGCHVAQILLTREDMDTRRRYLNARHTLERLLALGVVPIINENDSTAIEEIEFTDNDMLAAIVAVKIQARLLLILTTVDGLLSAGTTVGYEAEVIARIDRVTPAIEALADRTVTSLGRGGMLSKIKAADTVCRAGIPAVLANGRRNDVFRLLAEDRVRGTWFVAATADGLSRREKWILSARPGERRRRVVVDRGALRALTVGKKSLLAAGITRVEGSFGPGDVVDIVDAGGNAVACGLANYSAAELDRIKGLRSNRFASVLGRKPYDEAIHRDNLVILKG